MKLILTFLLAVIFPPLGVLIKEGLSNHLALNVVLTFFGWIPGVVHALYILLREDK